MKQQMKNALLNALALVFVAGVYVLGIIGFMEPAPQIGVVDDGCEAKVSEQHGLTVRVCDLPGGGER